MSKDPVWTENIGWVIPPDVPAVITRAKCTHEEWEEAIKQKKREKMARRFSPRNISK